MRIIRTAALAAAVALKSLTGVKRGMQDPVPDSGFPQNEPDPVSAVVRLPWMSWGLILAFLGAAGGLLALIVVASGIFRIRASSGHWPVTAWFLNFSMERSVATNSLGIQPHDLDNAAQIMKGAGHYDFGCRPCHGSPAFHHPAIPAQMTPHPPYLPPAIPQWKPRELFYIVKHGVKFTGMPAWPDRKRDDEIWAVVAFLGKMPGMTVQQYNEITGSVAPSATEAAPVEDLTEPANVPAFITASCARCHGRAGLGRGTSAFPKLAGQSEHYLYASLRAYRDGRRHSGIMQPLSAAMSDEEMHQAARWYAARSPGLPQQLTGLVEKGRAIANGGLPGRRIPACASCHSEGVRKFNPHYPVLNGQYWQYLLLQLELFKEGNRGGTHYSHIMHEVVRWLEPDEMKAVAIYYGAQAGIRQDSN